MAIDYEQLAGKERGKGSYRRLIRNLRQASEEGAKYEFAAMERPKPRETILTSSQIMRIPHWHPTPLNKLLGHWSQAHKQKKADREIIQAYAAIYGMREATGKRRVTLTVLLPKGKRATDPDSMHKSLLDGLVHAKLLVNDSLRWVELPPVQFARMNSGVDGSIVELTDI